MQYRKFGRLDWEVSVLGFGVMRLPTAGDQRNIIEAEATRMLRYAVDHGVNYLDTAYPYHGGESEAFLGRALGEGYRQRVRLATKLPTWMVERRSDFDRFLNEQLKRLKTERVDFYLLHALDKKRWPRMKKLGVLEWSRRAIADGRIGQFGFSFHDSYTVFKEIVDAWDWSFCQIQYNYMDVNHQAGRKGLRYAAARSLGVVVMEPILGGKLVNPPPPIQRVWDSAERKRSPAEWALRWVWDQPEVSVVLSGMSSYDQVVENVEAADRARIGAVSAGERECYRRVRGLYDKLSPIPCTQCQYCMPCPHGVDIPLNLAMYNDGVMYARPDLSRRQYGFTEPEAKASACVQCRECEPKCPQGIPISEWMPRIHSVLGEGEPYPKR